MPDLIGDTFLNMMSEGEASRNKPQEPNDEAKKIFRLLNEAEQSLFARCNKYPNLDFLVKLMHLKCINYWSTSFNKLLKLLKDTFSICNELPTLNYGAKKIVKDLGLHYEKIDVCKNDCTIYYKKDGKAYSIIKHCLSNSCIMNSTIQNLLI